MQLPKIDLGTLPDLETMTGLFGSQNAGGGSDDTIVVIMVYIYEAIPPERLF